MKKTTTPKRKRVTFEVLAEPNIKVFLAGTFNDWSATAKELKDKNNDGCYSGALMLTTGEYEYKFVIDGDWQIDADNPNFNQNKMGTLNSVVKVKTK